MNRMSMTLVSFWSAWNALSDDTKVIKIRFILMMLEIRSWKSDSYIWRHQTNFIATRRICHSTGIWLPDVFHGLPFSSGRDPIEWQPTTFDAAIYLNMYRIFVISGSVDCTGTTLPPVTIALLNLKYGFQANPPETCKILALYEHNRAGHGS